MSFLNQFKNAKLVTDEAGQAVIEYILILTVTVAVIVGIIFQFNQSFAEYADNYFGNYLECLLIEGELPSLGVEGGGVSASSCQEQFKPFTLSEGRPPLDSNSSNNNSDGNSTSDGKGKKNSPKKFSSSGGRSGSGSGSSSRSGSSGSGNSFAAKGTNNDRKKEKIVVGADGSSSIGKLNNNRKKDDSTNSKRGSSRVGSVTAFDPDKEDNKKGKIKVRKQKNEDEAAKKSKSFRQSASVRKNPELDVEMDLSLGDYLRYLIIAAILIVLLFVVGGQIFQANKGSE